MIGTEWDLTTALEVEREEGREEGRKEEREVKDKESVKNLHEYGMAEEQIAAVLKLPLERVKQYLN